MKDPLFILLNYNTGEPLTNCLDSLLRTCGQGLGKFLIVENGSKEEDIHRLHEYAMKSPLDISFVYLPTNHGFGGGVNVGLSWRRRFMPGCPVILVNADIVLKDPGWAEEWLEFLSEHPEVGITGSGNARFACSDNQTFYDYRTTIRPARREAQWVTGTVMALTPQFLDLVPEIDPYYSPGYYEDADLCFECFWSGLDVWAQRLRFWHMGQAAVKLNDYNLTPAVRNEEQFRNKVRRNQWFFKRKWTPILEPRRRGMHDEEVFLLRQKEQRTGGPPGAVARRLRFLRTREKMDQLSYGAQLTLGGESIL